MSNISGRDIQNMKSGIYLDKIQPNLLYVLFVSEKCKHSSELQGIISQYPEFGEFLTMMTIESVVRDGEKLPYYIQGVPTLIMQHRQTGQLMEPVLGDAVFEWAKKLIKPASSSSASAADAAGGVSLSSAHKVRFDPRTINGSMNGDPTQFQIPIDSGKQNDDIEERLKAYKQSFNVPN